MAHDVIDRLVRPANPVPNPQVLDADVVSLVDERERKQMQNQQLETDHGQETAGSSRRPWIGIAAAVVLVMGAVVFYVTTQEDDVVAEATPVEIANEYFDAYSAFDIEGVESMLAENAQVIPWESFAGRDWRADLRYLDAAGFELLNAECKELPETAEGSRVNCAYEAHGLGSDLIGLEPFGGHQFRLVIEDGVVTRSDMGFNFTNFAGAMWVPFLDWIQENHPADYPVMYVDDTLSRQTEEALALWEQRVEDYVAFVNGE